jgi:hypothetical protein
MIEMVGSSTPLTSIFNLRSGLCPNGPPTQAYSFLNEASRLNPQRLGFAFEMLYRGAKYETHNYKESISHLISVFLDFDPFDRSKPTLSRQGEKRRPGLTSTFQKTGLRRSSIPFFSLTVQRIAIPTMKKRRTERMPD